MDGWIRLNEQCVDCHDFEFVFHSVDEMSPVSTTVLVSLVPENENIQTFSCCDFYQTVNVTDQIRAGSAECITDVDSFYLR